MQKQWWYSEINISSRNVIMHTFIMIVLHYTCVRMYFRRFCQRIIPVTMVCRATEQDIVKHAPSVLAPHFHVQNIQAIKVHVYYQHTVSNETVALWSSWYCTTCRCNCTNAHTTIHVHVTHNCPEWLGIGCLWTMSGWQLHVHVRVYSHYMHMYITIKLDKSLSW